MHSLEVNSWNLIVFQFKRINWKRWVIYVSSTICWARVGSQNMLSFFFFWWLIFIRWLSYISVSTEEASAMQVLNGVVNRVRNVINLKLGREINIDVWQFFLQAWNAGKMCHTARTQTSDLPVSQFDARPLSERELAVWKFGYTL